MSLSFVPRCDANTFYHIVSPSLVDLSSNFIPVDDEEEDEDTYDDIEGVANETPTRPTLASRGGGVGRGQEIEEEDDEEEDIYEELPGMVGHTLAQINKQRSDAHTHNPS